MTRAHNADPSHPPLEKSMTSAIRSRQRLLALVLPLTAALYIAAEGINPRGTDQLITTTATAYKVLPIAAKHSTQLYLSGSLTELALAGVAVSYAAIAMLVRGPGSALATIAAVIGGIGAFCGAVVNVFVGINLAGAATAAITREAAARVLVENFNSGTGQVFTDVYAFSEFLAPILIGIALWRSRRVPVWLAILFAAGFELAEQTASVGPAKVVLLMAPFAVAMTLLSIRLWHAPAPSATTENQQTNRL
jgi:hypothetical protein